MAPSDYRDSVIEILADSEADLRVRVAHLEHERAGYRAVAVAAVHVLHDLTAAHDRLRDAHHRLIDEYRHLRAQTMRRSLEAA